MCVVILVWCCMRFYACVGSGEPRHRRGAERFCHPQRTAWGWPDSVRCVHVDLKLLPCCLFLLCLFRAALGGTRARLPGSRVGSHACTLLPQSGFCCWCPWQLSCPFSHFKSIVTLQTPRDSSEVTLTSLWPCLGFVSICLSVRLFVFHQTLPESPVSPDTGRTVAN